MQLNKLQELHAKLRKAKYFYYEKHESIMSDYEFDMMESEYKKLAEVVGINDKHNMAYYYLYPNVEKAFSLDQSHIISILTIITLVYENDAYGWRIFAIGGKEDNYKENISIWE